jgi:hypothetical protein
MNKRKKTKVEILIDALRDGTWHLGDELAVIVGYCFGDAIKKARTLGYQIETEWAGSGQKHKYRLIKA